MKYILISFFLISIYSNGQTTNTFPANGYVGIGTTTPQSKLEVYGGRLTQQGAIANDNNAVFVNSDATGYGIYSKGGLNTHYAFHFENQAGTSIMLGRGNGSVGIGTTNPQYKLDIAGDTKVTGVLEVSGPTIFSGGRLTQTGDLPNDNNAAFVNTSSTGYGFYSSGGLNNRYVFHFLNQSGASILYGRGDGNIGIGTIYPDSKLTVKGTIHAEEIKVDLNVPGPDYVFEPDYKLLSLEEIKSYIDQHKHLPEVPSAKEMETNGVNVSEMNMLLLKKIEELTLYLLEKDREIQSLRLDLDKLKK